MVLGSNLKNIFHNCLQKKVDATYKTSATCQGNSPLLAWVPPTILVRLLLRPHTQLPRLGLAHPRGVGGGDWGVGVTQPVGENIIFLRHNEC